MEYKDYYKNMGVAKDASQDEIKPRKISWARIYSASYWFHSALKKS